MGDGAPTHGGSTYAPGPLVSATATEHPRVTSTATQLTQSATATEHTHVTSTATQFTAAVLAHPITHGNLRCSLALGSQVRVARLRGHTTRVYSHCLRVARCTDGSTTAQQLLTPSPKPSYTLELFSRVDVPVANAGTVLFPDRGCTTRDATQQPEQWQQQGKLLVRPPGTSCVVPVSHLPHPPAGQPMTAADTCLDPVTTMACHDNEHITLAT